MNSYRASFWIKDFLSQTEESIVDKIANQFHYEHTDISANQYEAWRKECSDMKSVLEGYDGRILFEYSIPGLPRVIDVVLLIKNVIFVLEYKYRSDSYNSEDYKNQTLGYAMRLKHCHSQSNNKIIVPILVATDAEAMSNQLKYNERDQIYNLQFCNSSSLKNTIEKVLTSVSTIRDAKWEESWENGIYKVSPTLITALRSVWRENNVRGFKTAAAEARIRLEAENYIINTVVKETKERKGKSICFVTGVPGAGKTIVGLNTSVALQQYGASMLSGNGPLVRVLTNALQRDLKKFGDQVEKEDLASISAESIIRSAYNFKKEIFNNRLEYHVGEGIVTFKEGAEKCGQHIIIFDEAQRAWTQKKMISPGQAAKKSWQEEKFPFSEPDVLLWDMDHNDWGVFVCLVGGGQEIHNGEAGICEWLHALMGDNDNNKGLKNWHIYMSDKFSGEVYNSKDGSKKTVDEYRAQFREDGRLTISDSLYLTADQRSRRTEDLSKFVEALLNCKTDDAKRLYNNFKDSFHIYLTRDLEKAKTALRNRKIELEPLNANEEQNEDDIRIGMLMSSKAARMRPFGYEIKKESLYKNKVANWFLDSSDNVSSSNFLEIALNEFFVQGLELDVATVMWDADFRYNKKENCWDYFAFNDKYWSHVDKTDQELKRMYMKNAYRVLLTRSRSGMVIFVPEGSLIDQTRNPEFYNGTFEYLRDDIGLELL